MCVCAILCLCIKRQESTDELKYDAAGDQDQALKRQLRGLPAHQVVGRHYSFIVVLFRPGIDIHPEQGDAK